ncbi:hypothetical protein Ciccas_000266 [Cichlidogyrus casuarinus]|uniref:IST1 homolog n=1 Tax=Cichlidogyrus casuarinus TaxID=1844966 RepID=A0ABD2QNJ7_9PLAT
MSFFESGPNMNKLKTNLSIAIQRLKVLQKKKTEISEKTRAEIANLIKINKLDRARIRCEVIIRDDYTIEVYDVLELLCEILVSRFALIQSQKEIDKSLEETFATIIWCGSRLQVDIPEFKTIIDQFTLKYGKKYIHECLTDEKFKVRQDVMKKLKVEAIPSNLTEMYLAEISKSYNVAFAPDPSKLAGEFTENLIKFDPDEQFIPDSDIGFPTPGTSALFPHNTGAPYPTMGPSFEDEKKSSTTSSDFNPDDASIGIFPTGPPPAYNDKPAVKKIVSDSFNDPSEPNTNTLPSLPKFNTNGVPDASAPPDQEEDVDFDALNKRFEQLRKK